MAKVYGADLLKCLDIEEATVRKSIAFLDTEDIEECFVSRKNNKQSLSRINMERRILTNTDGTREFDIVVDNDGNEVRVTRFKNKWGKTSYVGNGVFASSMKALLKKTGWHMEVRRFPVWTKFVSAGSGMCGAYNGYYIVDRYHTNMVTGEYVGY